MSNAASFSFYLWCITGFTAISFAVLMGLLFSSFAQHLNAFSVHARQQWLWSIALLPYMCAAFVAFLTLLPSFWQSSDHCLVHSHSHFCWFHQPQLVFTHISSIATFLLFIAIFKIAKSVVKHMNSMQKNRALMSFAKAQSDGSYRIDSDTAAAFTLGLLIPTIIVSQPLADALTDQELNIVMEHERAHQHRRDPLRLWLFQAALTVYFPSTRKALFSAMELAIEQEADIHAARVSNDPFDVADTLIKVSRFSISNNNNALQPHACAFNANNVEARIQLLVTSDKGHIFPLRTFIVFLLTSIVLGIIYADNVHHAIEVLLYPPKTLSLH